MKSRTLRVVAFCVYLPGYQIVSEWASRHGHSIILLVTIRGARLQLFPKSQDIMATDHLSTIAAPAIAALGPDLIVCSTFPRRIPAEITEIPRYGSVNLHPSPLPVGRGPNPQRLVYEGFPVLAATLHRMVPEFDSGAILSQTQRPYPEDLSGSKIFEIWGEMLSEVLELGTARAIGGEWGEEQCQAEATYAAPFTDAERCLSWDEPARVIQRKIAALNLAVPTATAVIDGVPCAVINLRVLAERHQLSPGTVTARDGDVITVATADALVQARTRSL